MVERLRAVTGTVSSISERQVQPAPFKPLRFLHCIRSVNPIGGGPIEGLKQLAMVNISRGHTVEIVSLDSPQDPWVKECPVTVHAMGPSYLKYGYSPRLVPWLREHRRDYDVVIVNGIWQYNAFAAWRALNHTTTPYFVFTHGMLDPWFRNRYPLKHLKKWLYWPWCDYRVLRDATAVLFTSEQERRLARRSFWLYRCDEFVMNYGTAGPSGDAALQQAQFSEKFPELEGKRQILFLGRVHPKKGADLLLEAFARLLRERPAALERCQIVMAGPSDNAYGDEMKALAEKLGIADRITWTGMLTGDLKWGAYYNADVFVLPSHQENFGISVAEALACGVPVLISNEVNIWREICGDGAGMADADDAEGTYRLLSKWSTLTADERKALRAAARQCFLKRFHVERAADALVRAMGEFGVR